MINERIEVPRDISDKKITKHIENYLLDIFSENNEDPFSTKELLEKVRQKFSSEYGWDLDAHVSWALDMLHANRLIKRVAPGTWEADEGPDDVYTERETGHAPEGEFVHRGKDFTKTDTSLIRNKTEYNQEWFKSDFAVRTLKNMGKSEEDIKTMLRSGSEPFNAVTVKLALKKYFQGVES